MSDFFASRWVERPPFVLDSAAMPAGFRLGGTAAGVKRADSQDLDLGLVVSDLPGTVSAARFCDSGVLAAPVVLTRERCDLHGLRAVVANSGNANAATGDGGLEQAARMQEAAAAALGLHPREVAVASTGVIGVALPGERIAAAIPRLAAALSADGADGFAHAIRTTDALDKHVSLAVTLPSGTVTLAAQCKGAGMISPRFATMLCFVQTDADLSAQTAELLLGVTVKRSFDRISVDGQLSTNDTVILMASGASGVRVEPETDDERRFGEALDALLRQLALLIVADGEGARRVGRVHVRAAARRRSRASRARSRTRRWSRPRCSAVTPTGGASPRRSARRCPAALRWRSTSPSRASPCAAPALASPSTQTRWHRPSAAIRSSTRSSSRERAPRPSCSSPISATTT